MHTLVIWEAAARRVFGGAEQWLHMSAYLSYLLPWEKYSTCKVKCMFHELLFIVDNSSQMLAHMLYVFIYIRIIMQHPISHGREVQQRNDKCDIDNWEKNVTSSLNVADSIKLISGEWICFHRHMLTHFIPAILEEYVDLEQLAHRKCFYDVSCISRPWSCS